MQIPFRAYVERQTLLSIRNFLRSFYNFFLSVFPTMDPIDSKTNQSSSDLFDPTKPAVPVSYPIKTLEELESRLYFESFHFPFNKASVRIPSENGSLADRPRMLVCHDMAGGYLDDKWVQGGTNADAYAIWHWYLIDIFVYFSHTLVTLPPPCWINTAHRHGVKPSTFSMDGGDLIDPTVEVFAPESSTKISKIHEWDEGRFIANKLLSTKESAQMYAERLSELATALGFDGWLVNLEVKLDVGQIPNLKEFVSHLTKTMHFSVAGSLVIWYDSVTVDGKLSWQDQLNENNKPFFDICDGIFVNYTWKENYPKLSADVAGDRKFDVYMGIDVFGRNTYGGGKWNTNLALDVIKKFDVSAAIFAPGWVYETKQPPDFQTAQNSWWALVERSWGVLRRYPQVLPFYSNFDQGRGYHFAVDGSQLSTAPWNNISFQSFQPFLKFSGDPSLDSIQVLVDFKEASYSGGANITFKGTLEDNPYFTTRLFEGEVSLGNLPIHFTYSVKSDGSSLIGLSLEFSSVMKEKTSILLASGKRDSVVNQFSSKFTQVIMTHQVTKSGKDQGWVIHETRIPMNGHTLTKIHAVCYRSKPEVRGWRLRSQLHGEDNSLVLSPTEYFAILGHIAIKTFGQSLEFPPSTSWLVEGQYIKWTSVSQGCRTLSVKVIWRLKEGGSSPFPKYNIFVGRVAKQEVLKPEGRLGGVLEYLGVAQVEAFYVSDLTVSSGTSTLKFVVQVCSADGACQEVDDSPSFLLPVDGS